MTKINPAGRVYSGQEGSGQAQILKPFDATKFPQQEMAIKEKRKEDLVKEASKLKMVDIKIDAIPEYWNTEALVNQYSELESTVLANEQKVNKLRGEYMSLDPLVEGNRTKLNKLNLEIYRISAETNNLIRSKDREFKETMQHKDLWETEKANFNLDSNNYTEDSIYNLAIFPTLSLEEQQKILTENGGSLIEQKADYTEWAINNIPYLITYGEKLGFTGTPQMKGGFYGYTTYDGVNYDYEKLTELTLNSMWDKAGLLSEIKRLPQLEQEILSYYNKTNINEVTKRETYEFLKNTEIGQEFVDKHMPPEWLQTKTSYRQMRDDTGGNQIELTPEQLFTRTEGNNQTSAYISGVLGTVNKLYRKNSNNTITVEGEENVIDEGAYNAVPSDYQTTEATVVSIGLEGKIIDPVTGHEIEISANNITDKKNGGYATYWTALKDIKYTTSDGKEKIIKKGTRLSENDLSYLKAGKDYNVGRYYVTNASVRESGTNREVPVINIQSSLGYMGASKKRQDEEYGYEKQVIEKYYNYDINGQKASDIIYEKATEKAKADGRTEFDRYDLWRAKTEFNEEQSGTDLKSNNYIINNKSYTLEELKQMGYDEREVAPYLV